ncbi:MAG: hypothetical protein WBN68_12255 [Sedimenticolaceae bacterium]
MPAQAKARQLALAATVSLAAGLLFAAGDLTRRAVRLDPLVLDAVKGFSIDSYSIETGVYYRWRIRGDGREEYRLVAPAFFREIWVDRVAIEDMEVKPTGLYAVELGDAGEIDVWFVPIRPGTYEFYVEGLRTQGFRGVFVVK